MINKLEKYKGNNRNVIGFIKIRNQVKSLYLFYHIYIKSDDNLSY